MYSFLKLKTQTHKKKRKKSGEVQVATHWDSPLCHFDAPLEYYFCVVCPRNVFREQKMVMEVQVATTLDSRITANFAPQCLHQYILCTSQHLSRNCKALQNLAVRAIFCGLATPHGLEP